MRCWALRCTSGCLPEVIQAAVLCRRITRFYSHGRDGRSLRRHHALKLVGAQSQDETKRLGFRSWRWCAFRTLACAKLVKISILYRLTWCVYGISTLLFFSMGIPSGKLTQLWKITVFNGKINELNGHVQ
jgi:hypothetical protein